MKDFKRNDNLIEESYKGKRNVTPAIAVKILKKNGIDITEDETVKVLDLMYFLSGIIVKINPDKFK